MRFFSLFFGFALLTALMLVVNATRPLLPIDETRYLTVAWEYWSRGDWILPTLNYAPYHHKPPMLFWLIDGFWSATGTTAIWAARLVPLLAAGLTLALLSLVGRTLWPRTPEKTDLALLMLIGTPFFLIYSSLIMFDTLLTVAVLLGIWALLKAHLTGERRYWLLLGLALGLGALIKGPVILLHLLPVLLLAPLWQKNHRNTRLFWWGGIGIALLIGLAVGLAWALPAAKIGGPDYERMIFWGQSAGRMVKSFDHGRPIWFYLALLPLLLFPWILTPYLWRRGKKAEEDSWQARFLMAWILPVFIAFSLISGKQTHYLLPLLPAVFLLLAHHIVSHDLLKGTTPLRVFVWAMAPLAVLAAVFLGIETGRTNLAALLPANAQSDMVLQLALTQETYLWGILGGLLILAIALYALRARTCLHDGLRAATLGALLSVALLHATLKPVLSSFYDLGPLGTVIHEKTETGAPLAVVGTWEGELGYLAALKQPVTIIPEKDLAAWLARNPGGVALMRFKDPSTTQPYQVLYQQRYRSPQKNIALVTGAEFP